MYHTHIYDNPIPVEMASLIKYIVYSDFSQRLGDWVGFQKSGNNSLVSEVGINKLRKRMSPESKIQLDPKLRICPFE